MYLQSHDPLKWTSPESSAAATRCTPCASPALSSLPLPLDPHSSSSLRNRVSTSQTSKRAKPYDIPSRFGDDLMTPLNSPYDTWSPATKVTRHSSSRRRSDSSSTSYTLGNALGPVETIDSHRPGSSQSSVNSSLSGQAAGGDSHSSSSGSISPNAGTQVFDVNMHHPSSMMWSATPPAAPDMMTATQATYPAVPGPYNPQPNVPYDQYEPTSFRQGLPGSMHPSPFPNPSGSGSVFHDTFGAGRQMQSSTSPTSHMSSPPFSNHPPASTQSSPETLENEVYALRKRLREMETMYHQSQDQLRALTGDMKLAQPSLSSSPLSGHTDPPLSPQLQAEWEARTHARVQLFCSLNRAGNALCSWHDSRRERRAYPPRNAPPGYLNCGCSFEEALFEESLSRHNVGSYHPGESVRMDPALRNPLLRLLQERYGYRDGDFERDPVAGNWKRGEGPAIWEQKVHAGVRGKARLERRERGGSSS